MKRLFSIIILLILNFSIYCASYEFFKAQSDEELKLLAPFYQLDPDDKDLRDKLLKLYENSKVIKEEKVSEKVDFEIIHSDHISSDNKDFVILDGDVRIKVDNSQFKEIHAQKVILFLKNKLVSAIGNVKIIEEDKKEQEFSGNMISFISDDNSLIITDGSANINKENSDKKKINFLTQGKDIRINNEINALSIRDGFLTSNENRYSSIESSNISFLEEDLFLTNAVLYLGRVPIFYLPFLFYPGKRISINPSFGFANNLGAFVTISYEIYGENKNLNQSSKESTFAKILKNDDKDKKSRPVDLFYEETNNLSGLQKWAFETGSYLSIFADASEYKGISVALDTKNYLLDKSLELSLVSFLAFYNKSADIGISSRSFKAKNKFRYAFEPKLAYTSDYFSLDFSGSSYSDPYVLMDYGNRLTTFSFDSFLQTLEIPPKYSSSLNSSSYDLKINAGSKEKLFIFDSLTLSDFKMNVTQDYNDSSEFYELKKLVAPEFTIKASIIFDDSKKSLEKKQEPVVEDPIKKRDLSILDLAKVQLYEGIKEREDEEFYIGTKFSFDEEFYLKHNLEYDSKKDIKDLLFKMTNYSDIKFNLDFKNEFKVDQKVRLSLENYERLLTRDIDNALIYSLNVSIPYIGLTYELEDQFWQKHLRYSRTSLYDILVRKSASSSLTKFDLKSVKKHKIDLSKSFKIEEVDILIGFSTLLYPLDSLLSPRFNLKYKDFSSNNNLEFMKDQSKIYNFYTYKSANSFNYKDLFSLSYNLDLINSDFKKINHKHNINLSFFFLDKKISLSQNYIYDTLNKDIHYLNSFFKSEYVDVSYYSILKNKEYLPLSLSIVMKKKDIGFNFWKNRIGLNFNISGSLNIDLQDSSNTNLSINFETTLRIAEFMDFSFEIGSINRGFDRYKKNGNFSFLLMLEDLGRSFDFINQGRYNTQFVLNTLNFKLVHYMYDWNLTLSYETSLADNKFSGKASVFLQWNAIPEIKVDEVFK